MHKDIKPENILRRDGQLILTDFGTAFDWSKSGQSITTNNTNNALTPRYQSPEVTSSSGFHRSSDIWSLGVVYLEMVTILRGKSLEELDRHLGSHGTCMTQIHRNLEAATSWFQVLQAHTEGSPVDNEPTHLDQRDVDQS